MKNVIYHKGSNTVRCRAAAFILFLFMTFSLLSYKQEAKALAPAIPGVVEIL